MPSERLIMMGMLSKVPTRSSVLRRFLHPDGSRYTDYQKMHATALLYTPGISKAWITYQFERLGARNAVTCITRLKQIGYKLENRQRWQHLGPRNVLFLTKEEVIRYYLRSNPDSYRNHPGWARAVIFDMKAQGMTYRAIASLLNLNVSTVEHMFNEKRRSIFAVDGRPKLKSKGKTS